MKPERLAEPRALAMILAALVLVAALLVFTVGPGNAPVPTADQPLVLTPEGAATQKQTEAAWTACMRVGADAGCLLFVLDRTRSTTEMPVIAQQYRQR